MCAGSSRGDEPKVECGLLPATAAATAAMTTTAAATGTAATTAATTTLGRLVDSDRTSIELGAVKLALS